MMYESMRDELIKISVDTTSPEAMRALEKLKKLEEEKPSAGDYGRGALTGALVGPAAMLASAPLTEDSSVVDTAKAVRKAAPRNVGDMATLFGARKVLNNEAVQKGLKRTGMGLAAAGVSGAAFGLGLPILRRKLDVGAEKAELREALGQQGAGTKKLHNKVTQTMGV